MKVNSDAAFDEGEHNGATACVLRDQGGLFREAKAMWYDRVLDARLMEAYACRDGIQMALQAGYQRLALETDCLELVQLWKKDFHRASVGPVLGEIEILSRAFQNFSFAYVSRDCNKVSSCVS